MQSACNAECLLTYSLAGLSTLVCCLTPPALVSDSNIWVHVHLRQACDLPLLQSWPQAISLSTDQPTALSSLQDW